MIYKRPVAIGTSLNPVYRACDPWYAEEIVGTGILIISKEALIGEEKFSPIFGIGMKRVVESFGYKSVRRKTPIGPDIPGTYRTIPIHEYPYDFLFPFRKISLAGQPSDRGNYSAESETDSFWRSIVTERGSPGNPSVDDREYPATVRSELSSFSLDDSKPCRVQCVPSTRPVSSVPSSPIPSKRSV